MCEMCVIIFVTLSRTLLCWAQSVDLRNPWIALRNLWIHTLRRNPWIAQVSVDLDCLRDLPVLRTGLLASFFFRGTHNVRDELQLSHFVG